MDSDKLIHEAKQYAAALRTVLQEDTEAKQREIVQIVNAIMSILNDKPYDVVIGSIIEIVIETITAMAADDDAPNGGGVVDAAIAVAGIHILTTHGIKLYYENGGDIDKSSREHVS